MIRGYVGQFGSGKTLNMIWDACRAMYKGRRVVSNTPIELLYDPVIGKKKYLKAQFISDGDSYLEHLIYDSHCIFLVDEAAVYFPNQFWNKFPPELIVKFSQQRKFHTDFWYTVQRHGHTVKRMRDLAHEIIECHKRNILPWVDFWKIHYHGLAFYQAKRFSPDYFDGAQNAKKYERCFRGSRYMWPSAVKRAYRAYNTEYLVDTSAMLKLKDFMKKVKQMKMNKQSDVSGGSPDLPENTTGSVEAMKATPQVVHQ